ncbi:hypothetical protein LOK49_LG06G00344 [Camellia lanceoleosa]|uniref:Uncharacterized protein n=1 Tax=Camellia lanceoleosa TaxID=1840588 RepID=A0ACC0HFX5_9ERIC|nr:hypothetical protein LOK49_LG06G00344 [Camellia lanceoleosa]
MSLSLPLSHTTTCSHSSSLTNDFVAPIPPLYCLKSKVDTADSRTWTISFSPGDCYCFGVLKTIRASWFSWMKRNGVQEDQRL